jgi:outer membrane receptor protein involved in Fe transport
MDGWLKNALSGNDSPEQDDSTARLKLQWKAADNVTVKTSYERNEFETTGAYSEVGKVAPWAPASTLQALGLASLISGGVPIKQDDVTTVDNGAARDRIIALGGLGLSPEQLATLPGFEGFTDGTSDLFTLSTSMDFNDRSVTAQYGYAGFTTGTKTPASQIGLPTIDGRSDEDYDQHSLEIRLESTEFDAVEYLVGAFYQKSSLDFYEGNNFGLSLFNPLSPNLSRDMKLKQDTDTWSVFGSTTWSITDDVRAIFGLRYQEEKKDGKHISRNYPTGIAPETYDLLQAGGSPIASALDAVYAGAIGSYEHNYKKTLNDEVVSWLVKFEYDFNYDVMGYVSVSNGNKAGGFDARNVGPDTALGLDQWNFDPEKALNYEMGIKSSLLDGRVRLNATVFQTTVEDYQVAIYTPPVNFYVDNAAELQSRGVELETTVKATEELTITASLAYLDSEWQSFKNAPCTERQKVEAGCTTQDLTGARNIFSPEWAGNLTFNYGVPIGAFLLESTLSVNYSDEYFTDADNDPNTAYDAFTTVDLRLAVGDLDRHWNVALIGKNLTDEIKGNSRTDIPFLPGAYFSQTDRTRSIALQGTYNF